MSTRWLKVYVDIIATIEEVFIQNKNFDARQWCEHDAKILRQAASMIEEGLYERHSRQEDE